MSSPLLDYIEVVTGVGTPHHAVIWLHGLGADGSDFAPIVPELELPDDLPVRFVFPHAQTMPVTCNNGYVMRAWYDILYVDSIDRKVDLNGIRDSRAQIDALIAREIRRGVPAEHIVLAGFSQGGAMAYTTGLTQPNTLAGIIALSTYIPSLDYLNEHRHPANQHTPVFAGHGEFDNIVPVALGQRAVDTLKAHGQPVSWHTYPMMHAVCIEEIQAIGQWLRSVLK